MKEVPKKDEAEISGGAPREIGSCIPPATPPVGPDVTIQPDESIPLGSAA